MRPKAAMWSHALRTSGLTAALTLVLTGCNVYSSTAVGVENSQGGAKGDASHADVINPDPTGGAGGGGTAGVSGNDGSAGRGGGGTDVDSGGASGSHGDSGGDADGSVVIEGGDGFAGNDAGTDASLDLAGGDSGGGPTCNADAGGGACLDGAADMIDGCPADPSKTEPGACGCGIPDTDTDTDGTADCVDGCPNDLHKTAPGVCGCGADDPMDADAGQAFCLKGLLAHRYSFNGTGTEATDSIAAANGAIMGGSNASLSGGSVNLTGDLGAHYTNEGYVNLPSNLLSSLPSATFEAWVTWRGTGSNGNQQWQRIFDFGDQVTSGSELVGKTYLFVTARAGSSSLARAAFTTNGNTNETFVNATQSFPLNAQTHVAVVFDDAGDLMTLYLNGAAQGSVAWTGTLAGINDVNSWLGRSNFAADPEFNGIIYEFRIYRAPLNAAQIEASYLAGPDPVFF